MWDLYSRHFVGVPVDIWALGCLFYLLAGGRLPFEGEAKLQILNGHFAKLAGLPREAQALLAGMLDVEVASRWTIAQVRQRAYGGLHMAGGGDGCRVAVRTGPPAGAGGCEGELIDVVGLAMQHPAAWPRSLLSRVWGASPHIAPLATTLAPSPQKTPLRCCTESRPPGRAGPRWRRRLQRP